MTTEQIQAKANDFIKEYFYSEAAEEMIEEIEKAKPELLESWSYNAKKLCEGDGWKAVRVPEKGIVLHQEETGTAYKPLKDEWQGGHTESTWDYKTSTYTAPEMLDEYEFFVEDDEDGEIEVVLWQELFDSFVKDQSFYYQYWLVDEHAKELLKAKEEGTITWAGQHIWRRIVFHHNNLPVQQDPVILEIVKEFYNL